MGSPLAPTLANFYLGHMEIELSKDNDIVKPALYLRYVDDVFAVFSDNKDYMSFLNALNAYHPNVQFTAEIGNDSLCFLDTQISVKDGIFESWVYRKPTNTGVLLNFIAVCPQQWKIGLVHCLISRAWIICSTYNKLHEELENLKSIFYKNGYPVQFVERIIKKFLWNKFNSDKDTHIIDDEPKQRFLLKVPFIVSPKVGETNHSLSVRMSGRMSG